MINQYRNCKRAWEPTAADFDYIREHRKHTSNTEFAKHFKVPLWAFQKEIEGAYGCEVIFDGLTIDLESIRCIYKVHYKHNCKNKLPECYFVAEKFLRRCKNERDN